MTRFRSAVSSATTVLLFAFAVSTADAQTLVTSPSLSRAQAAASTAATLAYWTPQRLATAIPMEKRLVDVRASLAAAPVRSTVTLPPGFSRGYSPAAAQAADALASQSGSADIVTYPTMVGSTTVTFGSAPTNPMDGPYGPFQRFTQNGAWVNYPMSTVGKYYFSLGASNYVCSGTAINRSTVVTAGHCVSSGAGVFATNQLFCPAYNSAGVNPAFGCWAGIGSITTGDWHTAGNPNYDYACFITHTVGTTKPTKMGNMIGWAGRAWNWPTSLLEFSMGYPQAPPFDGTRMEANAGPDWYEYGFGFDGPASKFMGNDLTGGSSGGPWILGYANPVFEYADVDGSTATDPGFWAVNGVNSHKRCLVNCGFPPTTTTGVFWDEMSSPTFRLDAADPRDSEDVFAACFAHPNNLP